MTTPIGKFRERMDMFLKKLDSWATTEQRKELEKFRMKYDIGMRANPRDTLCYFLNEIEPHAHEIMTGDDEYFLGENINIEAESQVLGNQLKKWWPCLVDEKKNYIRDQFKLLLMLGAIATKHEPLREIINSYRDPTNPLIY
jgi:hypothetical protein